MVSGVGMSDYTKKARDLVYSLAPWEAEHHWNIYSALVSLVNEIYPELIVLDNMLAPATDIATNIDRRFVSLCPNGVLELLQPISLVAACFGNTLRESIHGKGIFRTIECSHLTS